MTLRNVFEVYLCQFGLYIFLPTKNTSIHLLEHDFVNEWNIPRLQGLLQPIIVNDVLRVNDLPWYNIV